MVSMKALAAIALTLVVVVPIGAGYAMALHDEEVKGYESSKPVNISDIMINSETPYFAEFSDPANNSMIRAYYPDSPNKFVPLNYLSVGANPTTLPQFTTSSQTVRFAVGTYTNVSNALSYTFWMEGTLRIIFENGTAQEYEAIGATVLYYNHSLWIDGVVNFANVASVQYMPAYDSITMTFSTLANVPNSYADPVAGWKLPNIPNNMVWMNGQRNQSVTFYITLENGQTAAIGSHVLTRAGGVASIDGVQIGEYSRIQLVYGQDKVIASGLAALPAFGAKATTYNSIERPGSGALFSQLAISGNATFRVDSANVVAGTFPLTKDYTLDLNALFPGVAMGANLNSIGIYGDYLTIGGNNYPVTNGTITVDGKKINLLHSVISNWENEDGTFSARINGIEVATTATPATITFGGEWSLAATGFRIDETSDTQLVWHPGEFAFDKQDFAACGLIVAGALLTILGLAGKRSVVKFGLLTMVLGGAALGYLILI